MTATRRLSTALVMIASLSAPGCGGPADPSGTTTDAGPPLHGEGCIVEARSTDTCGGTATQWKPMCLDDCSHAKDRVDQTLDCLYTYELRFVDWVDVPCSEYEPAHPELAEAVRRSKRIDACRWAASNADLFCIKSAECACNARCVYDGNVGFHMCRLPCRTDGDCMALTMGFLDKCGLYGCQRR